MSLFPENSGWVPPSRNNGAPQVPTNGLNADTQTPDISYGQLDDWYRRLDSIDQGLRLAENGGDVDGERRDLQDVRDEIYAHLRG
jgi:hypothetical protein